MTKHKSKWTSIYWDVDPTVSKLRPYVRLAPRFMALESAGFPHGISLGGFFEDEEAAIVYATRIDKFMDAMVEDLNDIYE